MSQEDQDQPLAINPDLIRKYASGASEWGIQQLIALFDFQRRQMQRAEDLCRIAWDQVIKEAKSKAKTETEGYQPKSGPTGSITPPSGGSSARKPKSKPTTEALEIDLEL